MVNKTKTKARGKRISKNKLGLRNNLWPDINGNLLWDRNKEAGFTTIPRTMPYIMQIMDEMSNGKPVSSTYFALWARVFDESFVVIKNPLEMAFESGFRGQRSEYTWNSRMKILNDLGFIDVKPGLSGSFHNVLLWNPYIVIENHNKNKMIAQMDTFNAFLERAYEVGAKGQDE